MEYKRHKNVKEATYEKLLIDRDRLGLELDFIDSVIKHYEESTCDNCGFIDYAYERIPDGWSVKKAEIAEMLLCTKCNKKWRERFNEDEQQPFS